MKTYLALTLGPIHKTILRQRKTRAVFAASYLFSYTMRKIMEKLLASEIKSEQILMSSPKYLKKDDFQTPGCGLYTDRLIMIGEGANDFDKLTAACESVLEHLADKLEGDKAQFTKGKTLPYLKQYLQLYCLRIELAEGKETINEINQALDSLELQSNFPYGADEDYLQEFFSRVGGHFLLRDAFGNHHKKQQFDSLEEIATRELGRLLDNQGRKEDAEKFRDLLDTYDRVNEQEQEQTLFEQIAPMFPQELQPYHRYVAVVMADADSLGKYVGNLNADAGKLLDVSNQLMELGKAAKDTIEAYGGASVYIGGDDLLFFAPVVSLNSKKKGVDGMPKKENIFDLLTAIDEQFYQQFEPAAGSPTLSYGVCLFYYKFPLNEALEMAGDLLYTAKNKKYHPHKNAIAFRLLKHSGQFFEAGIDKVRPIRQADGTLAMTNTTSVHYLFQQLLQQQITGDNFLNSLAHGMSFFQDLLGDLIIKNQQENIAGVQHLFDNTFNESIHHQNRSFINAVVNYIVAVFEEVHANYFEETNDKTPFVTKNKKAIATIHATLRYINFVKEKTNAYALQA